MRLQASQTVPEGEPRIGRIMEVGTDVDKVWQLDIRPPNWEWPLDMPSPITVFMAKRPANGDV